jgi:hypothetical protein
MWPWNKTVQPRRINPTRPDQWTDRRIFYNPRPQNPVNNPDPVPLQKTLETVPSGEQRVVFDKIGPGTFDIFTNNQDIAVEVNETFIFAVAAGSVEILLNGQVQTPVIPLAIGQQYSDSGFSLAQAGTVSLRLTGTIEVRGFLRWRYN